MYQIGNLKISDGGSTGLNAGGGGIVSGLTNWATINTKETIVRRSDIQDVLNSVWKKIDEELDNMETLYSVVVVNEYREILIDEKVVAKTEESAKFNADVYSNLTASGLSLDDVTIIVTKLGTVKVAE